MPQPLAFGPTPIKYAEAQRAAAEAEASTASDNKSASSTQSPAAQDTSSAQPTSAAEGTSTAPPQAYILSNAVIRVLRDMQTRHEHIMNRIDRAGQEILLLGLEQGRLERHMNATIAAVERGAPPPTFTTTFTPENADCLLFRGKPSGRAVDASAGEPAGDGAGTEEKVPAAAPGSAHPAL